VGAPWPEPPLGVPLPAVPVSLLRSLFYASLPSLFPVAAALAAPTAGDQELLRLGDHVITESDFRAHMERVPEPARRLAESDIQRNRQVLESLLVNRVLAARAREAGLDKNPVTRNRLHLQEESLLAGQYVAKAREHVEMPPLETRARELFLVNPGRYRIPEAVHLQLILVGLYGRTREMGLERANEAQAKALAGEDFLALARVYSDDPGRLRNKGDIGFVSEAAIAPELWSVARSTLKDGEVSAPIATEAGYYVLKRLGLRPQVQLEFDAVKATILDQERDRIREQATKQLSADIIGTDKVVWNVQAVQALTRQLSPDEHRRLSDEALRLQRPAAR